MTLHKRLILFILFFCCLNILLNAQVNLKGYKYVLVETLKYDGGRTDIWYISSKLDTYFSSKGFITLSENSTPNEEIKRNPCLLLRCFIDHTEVVVGTNQVTIVLKNCRDEIVYQSVGKAMGMTVQDDYNKATKRAFEKIQNSAYSFDPSLTPSGAVGNSENKTKMKPH